MVSEDEDRGGSEPPFQLPRYIRFARTLALVGGAAIGVAAGVAIVGTPGCGGCTGICGVMGGVITEDDASTGIGTGAERDGSLDAAHDASVDADHDAGALDGGGGPRPAPLLPRAWTV